MEETTNELNLGIKARRSKKLNNYKKPLDARNPLTNHTLDDDLPYIQQYSKMYDEVPSDMKNVLEMYIFEGKSLDYYYGCYVTAYQMFVMAYQSSNDISPALMSFIHAISSRIVQLLDKQKNQISEAKNINDIGASDFSK